LCTEAGIGICSPRNLIPSACMLHTLPAATIVALHNQRHHH
jgi:hypothetical protein